MEYRNLKKLNIKTSLLGFGTMRFPTNSEGKIDEEKSEKMLDYAFKNGVNYFDTAFPYHNGESEPFTGKILNKYPRDSYFLATKLPMWAVNTIEDVKKMFDNQLNRLQKDYVDFYLLHALNKDHWEKAKRENYLDYLVELKKQGKIKYIGFSFHDSYEVFEDIINYFDWDFCQIQFNYMDKNEQAGLKGYHLTEEKGIPLIIMEPVKGGTLASLPDDINKLLLAKEPNKSTASWALRWVAQHENVKVILSGMSNEEQVIDNINTFNNYIPLTKEDNQIIDQVVNELTLRTKNSCTNCKYCMPCPKGVNIPRIFRTWNTYYKYNNINLVERTWNDILDKNEGPDLCIKCGKCEKACPQQIPIRKNLEEANCQMTEAIKNK